MTEDKTTPQESSEDATLKKKIIRQVEFYFGDYNLMKDKFMRQQMKEDDGWFSMELMLQFKRLASICSEPKTILDALKSADETLLEIDSENQRIRRWPDRKVPKDTEEFRKALQARTVHVNGFQGDDNIDDIHEFLSDYGKIDGIQLQRTVEKKFKGSLFVTFAQKEDAEKLIVAPMVYYKCNELSKMSRGDYYKELENAKKNKKTEKKDHHDDKTSLIALKVSGLTDDSIIHRDVKQVFEAKGIQNIVYFDRLGHNSPDGYLIFRSDETPEDILKLCGFGDDAKATVKSATVEFSIPDENEKEKLLNKYFETKQKFQRQPGRDKKHGRKFNKGAPKRKGGTKTMLDSGDEAEDAPKEPSEKVAKLD